MHRQQISLSSSSSDELASRVLIHSAEHTTEHTLPISISPSSSVTTTTRSNTNSQTIEKSSPVTIPSKSTPSFAETQLLSVYYPSQNPKNPSSNDKCIFVEQQDRQPIRFRATYDPLTPSKSTQTSPLSTHGSTLIIDGNSDHGQYLKLHSGSQHLSDDSSSLSNELMEQSRYTYEEYIVNAQENHTRTSSSSSSSATTVIAQNEELDSGNSLSSNQRISSWPPVPDEIENEQKRPSRVQFAEQLVRVIPVSATNSLTDEPVSPPAVLPRTIVNDSHQPINQSKWMKTHMDNTERQNSSKSNRVNTLCSLFEQQNVQSTRSNNSIRTVEPEEAASKHGVEIRFRVNDPHIHHAEPAKIIPPSATPFTLEQIEQITGKQLKSFDQIGHYLSDGITWQWDEIFWLSLTTPQRDQLKDLEQRLLSRQNSFDNSLSSSSSSSTTETKRFKSTFKTIGTGTRSQTKTPSALTKYTEINVIDEREPSVSAFGSTPTITIDSEESSNSTKQTDSQITIIESGYNSADDRLNSSPIIEQSSTLSRKIDPLSYEHFIIDYLSTYAKHIRSNDGTLILSIDEQLISMANVRLPSSKENLILAKKVYLDAINYKFSPFETESDQLVIFLCEETILLPSDRWLIYRNKYQHAKWIEKLPRINRNIPVQIIPIILQWLSEHAKLELSTRELHVDGVIIPVIGRLDQLNDWNSIFQYLIRIGFVSYYSNEKLIRLANSELDIQRLLKPFSTELIERLANYLREVDIHFNNEDRTLILNENFIIPNEYVEDLFQDANLNAEELVELLLKICQIEDTEEMLILTLNNQILRLINQTHLKFVTQWLEQLSDQKLIDVTDQNDILIYPHNSEQQIFIKHEHIDIHMATKSTSELINMTDIAQILISYNYIQYSSQQWTYRNQILQLETKEHQLLSSHIRHIHVDEDNQQIDIEFTHDPDHFLRIPSNWYDDISKHNFDRSYIVVKLLNNGGRMIDEEKFLFNHQSYLVKFSSKEKEKLIDFYVEYINEHDGIQFDRKTNLLLLENPSDGSELILTKEHTEFMQQNHYRREDMKYLLNQFSEIRQDEFGNWLLCYNNQCIQLPSVEQVQISSSREKTRDANLQLLFPSNKSLRLIQKTPSTTTLDIEQPSEQNDYVIDPLLILANYIHRAGTLYQDEFGRLVIKLNRDEIVVPQQQAVNSILEINTSPNRTGTIIARLIARLGRVQSNKTGGIIITIGKGSLELTREVIEQSKTNLNLSTENLSSSESLDTIKKSRSQSSLTIKPRLLIIQNETTRFYVQQTYEDDGRSNSVQPTQPRLIAPEYYRDMTLRDATVHVRREGEERESSYENLAQYLSTNQTDLSSQTVRRMLKFTTRDEYFAYLNNQISANLADELVRESEQSYPNIDMRIPERENNRQRSKSPGAFYHVKNGRRSNELFTYDEPNASSSSLSRSPQTSNGQSLTTPEKHINLPRSTPLSGQSNDGESESRATVSRSTSAAAKVATSKSDTIKSNTSSSAASSREHPKVSSSVTVTRTQSLVSPNRTSGSKGGGDEVKKEKKSKFRTPSFLRKRKEKKEAVNKEKAEK